MVRSGRSRTASGEAPETFLDLFDHFGAAPIDSDDQFVGMMAAGDVDRQIERGNIDPFGRLLARAGDGHPREFLQAEMSQEIFGAKMAKFGGFADNHGTPADDPTLGNGRTHQPRRNEAGAEQSDQFRERENDDCAARKDRSDPQKEEHRGKRQEDRRPGKNDLGRMFLRVQRDLHRVKAQSLREQDIAKGAAETDTERDIDLHHIVADQPIIKPIGEDARQCNEHPIRGAGKGCDGEVRNGEAAGEPRGVCGAGNAHNLIHERSQGRSKRRMNCRDQGSLS